MAKKRRKTLAAPVVEPKISPSGFFKPDNPHLVAFRESCGLPPLTGYDGDVTCLRCQKEFKSPDRRTIRVCGRCKDSETWREGALHAEDVYMIPQHVPPGPAASPAAGDGGKAHRARLRAARRVEIQGRQRKKKGAD